MINLWVDMFGTTVDAMKCSSADAYTLTTYCASKALNTFQKIIHIQRLCLW